MKKIGTLAVILTGIFASFCIADGLASPPDINTLSWMAGKWRGDFDGNPFESYYTSPEGGAIISVSKEFPEGKPCFIEFEKFTVIDTNIVLTPYPDGKQSKDFILTDYNPVIPKAKFVNYKNDFPTEIIYELVSSGKMTITVAGPQKDKRLEFKINLVKVK